MHFPKLKFVEFTILGCLLEGELSSEALKAILMKDFQWVGLDRDFFLIISRLKQLKLILTRKHLVSSHTHTRQQSSYELSELGVRHWKYSFDFFQGLIERWKPQAHLLPRSQTCPDLSRIRREKRLPARLPNPTELESILQGASPEFAAILKLSIECSECIFRLSAVEICDINRDDWTFRMANDSQVESGSIDKMFAIPDNCRRLIESAIAGRKSGLVFMTPSSRPWQEENLRMCWRRLKEKLNLSRDLVMPSSRSLACLASS